MTLMICKDIAPFEVSDILRELSINNEATEFVLRTLREAEFGEGLTIRNIDDKPNCRTITLMFIMQARMLSEIDRENMLRESGIVSEISDDNSDDLLNWDGIVLAMLFASNWLLDRMIACIPPTIRSVIISQMPVAQHALARSIFTT